MSLAAVILNYNDAQTTIDAASRVGGFSCVDHVLIVDNASPDGSAETIAEAFGLQKAEPSDRDAMVVWVSAEDKGQKICLLSAKRNGGYGYGNNLGVRYAQEILKDSEVLIANPDAVFSEKLVQKMLETLREDPSLAAVGAVMRNVEASYIKYDEFTTAGWCERSLTAEVLHSGPLSKRIFFRMLEYPEQYYRESDRIPVYAVHGSLLMVSAAHFLSAGGYDEDLFLYMEEYVLGHRLKEAGYKTVLLPLLYRHGGSHSITGAGFNAVRRQLIRQQSERIYYRKYLGAGPAALALIQLFQAVVLAETWLAVLLGRL